MLIINYEHVDIFQGDNHVLKDVNFTAEEGELIYIVGPVGGGKTTLFYTLYGRRTPAGGTAEVLGHNMLALKDKHLPALRRQIGIVFQDNKLLHDRSVRDNLDFVLRATGWNNKEDRERRIIEVLEEVGLPDKTNHRPYQLSGGEQQRIGIARAILNTPKLILADEPTGNLDEENGRNIIQLLNKIRQEGTTVIITTHNKQWINEIPGTLYRCENGELAKVE